MGFCDLFYCLEIYKLCKKEVGKKQKKRTGFVVCFYRTEEDILVKADKKPINEERKEIIKMYIQENGSITNKAARELLGLADSTTKRILKEMVREDILKIEGERKARKYLLS